MVSHLISPARPPHARTHAHIPHPPPAPHRESLSPRGLCMPCYSIPKSTPIDTGVCPSCHLQGEWSCPSRPPHAGQGAGELRVTPEQALFSFPRHLFLAAAPMQQPGNTPPPPSPPCPPPMNRTRLAPGNSRLANTHIWTHTHNPQPIMAFRLCGQAGMSACAPPPPLSLCIHLVT